MRCLTVILLLLLPAAAVAAPFTVTVTATGEDGKAQPVRGARVAVLPGDSVVFAEQVLGLSERVTDAEGKLVLAVRPEPGRELLVLAGMAFRAIEIRRVTAAGNEVVIDLPPEAKLRLRVLDAAGRPVPGAEVLVAPEDQRATDEFLAPGSVLFRQHTDGDGETLVLRLSPRGRYRARASLPGYPPAEVRDIEIGKKPVELRLPSGATVRGRVTADPSGLPLAKAEVTIGDESAVTDAKGQFVIYGIVPGLYFVEVRSGGKLHTEREPVLLRTGDVREGLTIRVQALGRLIGKVLGAATRPAAGTRLYLRYPPGASAEDQLPESRVILAGEANEEGRFDLRNLPPAQGVDLIAVHPEHAPSVYHGYPIQAGRTFETIVFLRPGGAIAGKVLAGEGREPVAGATLLLLDHREDPAPHLGGDAEPPVTARATATAEDGTFELAHVSPGQKLLIVRGEGHVPLVVRDLEVANRDRREGLELVLGKGARARGRVLAADGSAVMGASVTFTPAVGQERTATTDEEGRFDVAGIPPGLYLLRVIAEGFSVYEVPEIEPGADEIEVALLPAEGVAGRVLLGDSDEPAPGATIRALLRLPPDPLDPERVRYTDQGRVRAGPNGQFRIEGLSTGTYRFEAWTTDGAFGFIESFPVESPGDQEVDLRVTGGWPVTGLVLDSATGAPIEGAQVGLLAAADTPDAFHSVTDSEGVYHIAAAPAGFHDLKVKARGYADRLVESVEVHLGRETRVNDISLDSGSRVRGKVYGPDGLPSRGTRILFQSATLREARVARTDEWGEFELRGIAAGNWLMIQESGAAGAGARRTERLVVVQPGENLYLTLGGATGAGLTGHVRTNDGRGVANARVLAFHADEEGSDARSLHSAVTDEDGRFRLTDLPEGRVVALVYPPRTRIPARFAVRLVPGPGNTEDFVLPDTGITGTVVERGRGDMITGATVRVTRIGTMEGGSRSERLALGLGVQTMSQGGQFVVSHLATGEYLLEVFAPGYGRTVAGPVRIRPGVKSTIRIELAPGGSVGGIVLDEMGRPLTDARVGAFDAAGRPISPVPFAEVDHEGRFRIDSIGPGTFGLEARAPGRARGRIDGLRVAAGELRTVVLRLRSEGRLEVRVYGPGGVALPGAAISIRDFWGRSVRFVARRPGLLTPGRDPSTVDRAGALLVPNLPTGVYEITARLSGYDGRPTRVMVLGGETARAAVTLLPVQIGEK